MTDYKLKNDAIRKVMMKLEAQFSKQGMKLQYDFYGDKNSLVVRIIQLDFSQYPLFISKYKFTDLTYFHEGFDDFVLEMIITEFKKECSDRIEANKKMTKTLDKIFKKIKYDKEPLKDGTWTETIKF